jgi:hypothetical protein
MGTMGSGTSGAGSTGAGRTGTGSRSNTTQQRPRATSDQRVRVRKGMSGEAAGTLDTAGEGAAAAERARLDSINVMAQRTRDSLANAERMRADSVARIERMRADSLAAIETARRDSVALAEARRLQMPHYRFGGSWYAGVGGGAAAPTGDFQDLGYNSGFDVNVPIGWQRPNALLGARLDLGYSRFSGRQFIGNRSGGSAVTLTNANPQVLSAALNLTAQVPLRFVRNLNLYGVGGGGIYHFRSFGNQSALGGFLGNDVLTNNASNMKTTRNKFGAQVGAGLDWTVGTSSIFLESRMVNVFANRDANVQFSDFFGSNRSNRLQWVPIVLGLKIH